MNSTFSISRIVLRFSIKWNLLFVIPIVENKCIDNESSRMQDDQIYSRRWLRKSFDSIKYFTYVPESKTKIWMIR